VQVWRLALGRHREVDGEGARLYGGRWNSPGVPMVYAATHLSLALLEQLVHLNPARLPGSLRAFAIELPEDAPVEAADPAIDAADREAARRAGDAWAAARISAALVVPSALVPARLDPGGIATAERNVLLNPRHASVAAWRVRETAFRVDPRLKRAAAP
jgi:RES domain-containing protein